MLIFVSEIKKGQLGTWNLLELNNCGIDQSRKINYDTQNSMGMVTVKVLTLPKIPTQIQK